jgi:membrane protease YdiL (CAAX protease family)
MPPEVQSVDGITRPVWSVSTALLVGGAGFFILVATVVTMSTVGVGAYSMLHFTRAEANAANIILSNALAASLGYFLVRALTATISGDFFSSIEWRASYPRIALTTLLGIGATFMVRVILTGHLAGAKIMEIHLDVLTVLVLLGTVIVEPFVEEAYFRGILFAALSIKFGPLVGVCLVTLVFALGHGHKFWIVLPVSILLGIVRLLTKSTANCFAFHAAYNLGVVLWGIR